MWSISIGTLFPCLFSEYFSHSCAGRAMKCGVFDLNLYNLKDYGIGNHKVVDDKPFGGGPGMIIRPDVVDQFFWLKNRSHKIYMSPRGRLFNRDVAYELIKKSEVAILCGRYEGVDQRVLDHWNVDEISIGDFVTFGGEAPALCLLESCIRLLPGVIKQDSMDHDSFESGYLEHDQYTRPSVWNSASDLGKKYSVPDVLLSGHHQEILKWRELNSQSVTKKRRPDLWYRYVEKKDI